MVQRVAWLRVYNWTILDFSTRWKWVVRFTTRPLYRRFPLDRKVGGPQSRSERRCLYFKTFLTLRTFTDMAGKWPNSLQVGVCNGTSFTRNACLLLVFLPTHQNETWHIMYIYIYSLTSYIYIYSATSYILVYIYIYSVTSYVLVYIYIYIYRMLVGSQWICSEA
jgi:hypothetical protein